MSDHIPASSFKDVIPAPTSSLCDKFVKALIRLPTLVWQWMVDVTKTDGTINGVAEIGDYMFSATPSVETAYRKLCTGQELLRTDYPELYALIGTTYGTPSSGLVFKLPDLRGRFPVGVGAFPSPSAASVALGGTGGEADVILTPPQTAVDEHVHCFGRMSKDSGSGSDDGFFLTGVTTVTSGNSRGVSGDWDANHTEDIASRTGEFLVTKAGEVPTGSPAADAHNNLPPYIGVYVYIRVK